MKIQERSHASFFLFYKFTNTTVDELGQNISFEIYLCAFYYTTYSEICKQNSLKRQPLTKKNTFSLYCSADFSRELLLKS